MASHVGTQVAHPGVANHLSNPDETRYHSYYQWVPFMLFFQVSDGLVSGSRPGVGTSGAAGEGERRQLTLVNPVHSSKRSFLGFQQYNKGRVCLDVLLKRVSLYQHA